MTKSNIACCYYPTLVVFIDDNRSFLDNVLLELDENINIRSFTEPTKAIEYLKQHELRSFSDKYLKSLKDNEIIETLDYNSVEHGYVDIDAFGIHQEIYNKDRFNDTVVVLVDYTMPGMNGLEFCRTLKNLLFKFVLVTGDATMSNAIEAFNEGLIHQFISKSASDFTNKLQNIISELQHKQFEEHSAVIIKNLSVNRSSVLCDPVVIKFLKSYFKGNDIVEYYLVNEAGCFLMADLNGNLSWMVIKSEDDMTEYTNTAIDNYGTEKIIQDLRTREKILFLYTQADHINIGVDVWEKYLYPATKLTGENGVYYYSHIKEMDTNRVSRDKIISYAQFLEAR